jgi:hypothetical protein
MLADAGATLTVLVVGLGTVGDGCGCTAIPLAEAAINAGLAVPPPLVTSTELGGGVAGAVTCGVGVDCAETGGASELIERIGCSGWGLRAGRNERYITGLFRAVTSLSAAPKVTS